jgi:UDP-GlcNAc3NAcA epimerase
MVESGFILSTIHRAENTDDPESLGNIIAALNVVAAETPVILPLHPRTRKLLSLGDYDTRNITLLDPVGYLEMVWLLEHCKLVVTDSGGLQKEAYFFGKPCVTTREETEWVELVENGWNSLASIRSSPNNLLALIVESNIKKCLLANTNLYGDGITGVLICEKF